LRQKADCEGKIGKIKSYFEKNGGCFWLVFSFFWSSKNEGNFYLSRIRELENL
jgi:hypothetical protein